MSRKVREAARQAAHRLETGTVHTSFSCLILTSCLEAQGVAPYKVTGVVGKYANLLYQGALPHYTSLPPEADEIVSKVPLYLLAPSCNANKVRIKALKALAAGHPERIPGIVSRAHQALTKG